MPVKLIFMRKTILSGLRPQSAKEKRELARIRRAEQRAAAKESAYYESLGPDERADYDAMTIGMMPRLPR